MDLDTALAVLGSEYTADDIEHAALAVVGMVAGLAAVVALAFGSMAGATGMLASGAAAGYALHRLPVLLATARHSRALGDGPALVCRAVLAMRLAPTLEDAARFASEHGDGPLAGRLGAHARRARTAPGTGWETFADEWGDRDPALHRAVSLLLAAATAPENERERVLDRALDAVLDGTRDRLHAFGTSLTGPTNAIYGFGVVLPLALVGALPAAAAAGVPVSLPFVAFVFDLVLPAGLLAASAWLVARRPSAFPPTRIPRDHPARESLYVRATACTLVAGVLGWLLAPVAAPAWTRWLVAPGLACGAGLLCWARPLVEVRERVQTVESGLPDAVELAGRRLQRGEPLETALPEVGRALGGLTGDLFVDAAAIRERLAVTPEQALLGAHSPLAALPSTRAESELALLALAARAGPRGGEVLVTAAHHLDALRALEAEARRSLSRTTETLGHTAAVFAPLIGGTTVALAARLGTDRVGDATGELSTFAVEPLGLAIGLYVLLLAAVLAALATALAHGFDRPLVARRVGTALLSASLLFPAALVGVSTLL